MVVTTWSGIKCQRLDRVSNVALLGEQWLKYLDKIDKCAEFTSTAFTVMKWKQQHHDTKSLSVWNQLVKVMVWGSQVGQRGCSARTR